MAQARGSQTTVAIYEESAYGQTPGTPAGKKLYINSCNLAASQNRLDSNTIGTSRARQQPAAGNIDAGGSIGLEIGAESLGTLLKHALGQNATTGTGPYTHTLTLGDLPAGLIVEKDYGANISGSGRYEYFNGCRVNSASFKFPSEGYVTANFDIKGAKSTLASSPLDATLDDAGHTSFSAFQAAILEGGSAIAVVTDAEIKIDNGLDAGVYVIGGAGVRSALPEGFATISGSITALFSDATLLTKSINGTASSLKITLSRGTGDGSAGNESIEFLVEQMLYERASPPIDGPAGLKITLPFKGYRSGANNGLKITLKNAVATI